ADRAVRRRPEQRKVAPATELGRVASHLIEVAHCPAVRTCNRDRRHHAFADSLTRGQSCRSPTKIASAQFAGTSSDTSRTKSSSATQPVDCTRTATHAPPDGASPSAYT